MINLFNNIYIDFDHNLIKSTHPYILISSIVRDGFVPELTGNQIFSGKNWFSFLYDNFQEEDKKSVETPSFERINEEDSLFIELEEKFWDFLFEFKSKEKIIIYLDAVNFRLLFSKYLKVLFVKKDDDFIDRYYSLSCMSYQYFYSRLGRKDKKLEQRYLKLIDEGRSLYKTSLDELYSKLSLKLKKEVLPVELLVASYLFDESSKDKLEKKLLEIIEVFVKKELLGLKRDLMRDLPFVALRYTDIKEFDVYNSQLYEKCFSESSGFGAILNLVDENFSLKSLEDKKEEIYFIYDDFYKKVGDSSRFSSYILKQVLLNGGQDLCGILSNDIDMNEASYFLTSSSHDNFVNPYLIGHIYSLFRKDKSLLGEFVIEEGNV